MPVSRRCPGRPELCYLLVGRSRDSAAAIAIWPVAVTTRTKVPCLPWQMHDSGESGIATPGAPGHHMISGPTARSAVAVACPARTNAFICPTAKPCAIMSALRRAVRAVRARAWGSGLGPWRRWQSGASAESVSASMAEYTQTRVRMRRPASKTNAWVVVESMSTGGEGAARG